MRKTWSGLGFLRDSQMFIHSQNPTVHWHKSRLDYKKDHMRDNNGLKECFTTVVSQQTKP